MNYDKLISTGTLATTISLNRITVTYWLNKLKIEPASTVGFGNRQMKLYDKSVIEIIQNARRESDDVRNFKEVE